MFFKVGDYPKFMTECIVNRCWFTCSYASSFTTLGFKTYEYDEEHGHWLDDYEFTWFLLRFS